MSHSGWPTVLVTQFSRGKELPVPWIRSVAWGNKPSAATPDPTAVERAILLEEEANSVRIGVSPGGPAEQRMTLSDFMVVDLGPLPVREIDRREMLADGGWDKLIPRQSIVAENSYGHHTGGWRGWNAARLTVTVRVGCVRTGKNSLRVVSGGWGFRDAH